MYSRDCTPFLTSTLLQFCAFLSLPCYDHGPAVKASSADLPITTKSKQLGGESTPPAFINAFAVAVPKESGDRARRGSLDKGTLCSSSSECASGLCLGIDNKHCCGPKGKSKGCTNCDYDGDCSCFGSTSPNNCVACAYGYEQIDSGPHQYECFATTTTTTTTTTTYTFKYTDFDVRSTWQIAAYVVVSSAVCTERTSFLLYTSQCILNSTS